MPRSRSPGSQSDDGSPSYRSKRHRGGGRQYKKKGGKNAPVKLDSERIAALDAQVELQFQAAIETEDVKNRIQERLKRERARMEQEVEAKIAAERRVQLMRKRKEQEQRLKDQAELERILEENQKKLEQAQQASEKEKLEESTVAEKIQSLVSAHGAVRAAQLEDDVFVLGRG